VAGQRPSQVIPQAVEIIDRLRADFVLVAFDELWCVDTKCAHANALDLNKRIDVRDSAVGVSGHAVSILSGERYFVVSEPAMCGVESAGVRP
jgi:hypothetical protein